MNLLLDPITFSVTTDNTTCVINASIIGNSITESVPELDLSSSKWTKDNCTLFRRYNNVQVAAIKTLPDIKSIVTIHSIYLVEDQRGNGIGQSFLKKFIDNFENDVILFVPNPTFIDGFNDLYNITTTSNDGDNSALFEAQRELYHFTMGTYESWLCKQSFANVTNVATMGEEYDGLYHYLYTGNDVGFKLYNSPEIKDHLF